jgi:dolichol-phosphate mannosyltransferase
METKDLISGSRCAIIIPAYNECDNLEIIIPKIFKLYPGVHLFVVDDSAETEAKKLIALKKSIHNPNLEIIFRSIKSGRGSAVIDGLTRALQNNQIKYFMEMDGDMAHDPAECRLLLQNADTNDLVIGSRYMTGSKIYDWPKWRLVESIIINYFLNFWLGLKLTDYTNGFRLYSRRAAILLSRMTLHEKGFIALSEIAYKIRKTHYTITEIPVSFTDRKYGKSNAGFRELAMSFIGAIRIRFRD